MVVDAVAALREPACSWYRGFRGPQQRTPDHGDRKLRYLALRSPQKRDRSHTPSAVRERNCPRARRIPHRIRSKSSTRGFLASLQEFYLGKCSSPSAGDRQNLVKVGMLPTMLSHSQSISSSSSGANPRYRRTSPVPSWAVMRRRKGSRTPSSSAQNLRKLIRPPGFSDSRAADGAAVHARLSSSGRWIRPCPLPASGAKILRMTNSLELAPDPDGRSQRIQVAPVVHRVSAVVAEVQIHFRLE